MLNSQIHFTTKKSVNVPVIVFYTAPESAPSNFRGHNVSTEEIQVYWNPPNTRIPGILREYVLLYHPLERADLVKEIRLKPAASSHLIDGLSVNTTYSIWIAAVTIKEGPFAATNVSTAEKIIAGDQHIEISFIVFL